MAGVRSKPRANGKYQGWYMDHTGRRVFFIGTRKQAETRRMAEGLEDQHRQIRLGYRPVPKSAVTHAKRSFREVADEYLAWGKSQGGRGGRPWGKGHAYGRQSQLKWWQCRLGLLTLADLDCVLPRVEDALRELLDAGRTGKTLNNYAESLRAFCNWCKERGYLDGNPLEHLGSFDSTPRQTRRALTREEVGRLLAVSEPRMRLLYQVALCSGLRVRELRSLCVADLDVDRRGLQLSANWTKNRKPGFQPLPRWLVQELSEHVEGKPADVPLLYVPYRAWKAIGEDYVKADIPQYNPHGKVDFHALRVTYATLLVENGATAKEAQQLLRHSTPVLTLNRYARTRPERLARVTDSVGQISRLVDAECAHSVHRVAVGEESLNVSALQENHLERKEPGGGYGARTRDLDNAIVALSQLS